MPGRQVPMSYIIPRDLDWQSMSDLDLMFSKYLGSQEIEIFLINKKKLSSGECGQLLDLQ